VYKRQDYHRKKAGGIRNKRRSKEELEKASNIEGGLIAINPFTGEIISYVGGSGFTAQNQNDSVSQIYRQPGSSFKPIVYCSAIENRDITPSTVILDEAVTFKGGYSPKNYNHKHSGNIIVREALRKSVNVVAVKVLEKTGYNGIFNILEKSLDLSRTELDKRFHRTLSLALGTYEISPLENCVLHSVIANGGDYVKPYGLRFVKDYNSNVIWNFEDDVINEIREKRGNYGKIIDPAAAAVTVSILQGVFEEGGTAWYAVKNRNIDFQIAGKTGTSTNYNDAWFVGYASNLVTAVWIGNKKGAISLGKGRAGGSISAPVWAEFLSSSFRNDSPPDFDIAEKGISREKICSESGLVALRGGECPRTVEQIYYSGTEPGEFCNIHVKNEDKGDDVSIEKKEENKR